MDADLLSNVSNCLKQQEHVDKYVKTNFALNSTFSKKKKVKSLANLLAAEIEEDARSGWSSRRDSQHSFEDEELMERLVDDL